MKLFLSNMENHCLHMQMTIISRIMQLVKKRVYSMILSNGAFELELLSYYDIELDQKIKPQEANSVRVQFMASIMKLYSVSQLLSGYPHTQVYLHISTISFSTTICQNILSNWESTYLGYMHEDPSSNMKCLCRKQGMATGVPIRQC